LLDASFQSFRSDQFYPFAFFPTASACLEATFKPAIKSRAGARLGCDAV